MRKYLIPFTVLFIFILSACDKKTATNTTKIPGKQAEEQAKEQIEQEKIVPVDTAAYTKKLKALANGDTTGLWPVKTKLYPSAGAIYRLKESWLIMVISIRKEWVCWANTRQRNSGEN